MPACFYLAWIAILGGLTTAWPARLTGQTVSRPAKVTFAVRALDSMIDISLNGHLITTYRFSHTLEKPVLYPLFTLSAQPVTRGWPLDPRAGERVDHPHHLGLWLNYGDVNGLDFWNNSAAIPPEKMTRYGKIWHKKFSLNPENSTLTVFCDWKNSPGETLLEEETTFTFSAIRDGYCLDRSTTLTATQDILFKDNKEGFLGLRVARQLELPSNQADYFTDAQGKVTEVKALDNTGVSGNYLSSAGLTGDTVWGTRGSWVKLSGRLPGGPVSITIMDHPANVGYPTYWHARGYGLFAANPLGQAVFSPGKELLMFKLAKGANTTFRHRVVVHDGPDLPVSTIEALASDFAQHR